MLYEVTLFSMYAAQEMVNRWNYVSTGESAATMKSLLLARGMGFIRDNGVFPATGIFAGIFGMSTGYVLFRTVSVRAVYDAVDFYETPFVPAAGGSQLGDAGAPFETIGFRTNRVRQDIGRGTKRFSGFPDAWVGVNGNLSATALTAANTLATRMTAPITVNDEGNSVTFSPCVVKKEKYPVPNTSPVRHAYRYYEDPEIQNANLAVGVTWEVYANARSQTSRQVGRGQ